MAQFFKAKPNRTKQLSAKLQLEVTQLDHLGAGIAEHQGKVVFIPGALPSENVTVQLVEQKKKYAHAKLLSVNSESAERTTPTCEYYQQCGGCDLQHLSVTHQREHKQRTLSNLMQKAIATSITADLMVTGHEWQYRRRARLAIWFDKKTKLLTLGFRAASSSKVIAVKHCAVLVSDLSELIEPFAKLLNQLTCRATLGHLELIQADNGVFAVLRVTKSINSNDQNLLATFAAEKNICLLLQGDDGQMLNVLSRVKDTPDGQAPYYQLGDDLKLNFSPGNFIQVNAEINQLMVEQAIHWLAPQADERVLDLFCGMGNFSLPLSQAGAEVVGVEGVPEMVSQAKANALHNNVSNALFYHADLSSDLNQAAWLGKIDKLLLDPARAGAFEILHQLETMQPRKIVYVSCNPASLARDAQVLIKQGYQLTQLGMIDMFPQTHHIEAIALFEMS